MITELRELQQKVYQNAVDKGFWEDGDKRNKGEMVMLIISELGECLEAHRTGKTFKWHAREVLVTDNLFSDDVERFKSTFLTYAKDTYEDEMADVIIRILDYTGGLGIKLKYVEYPYTCSGNFGEDLLRLTAAVVSASETENLFFGWSSTLAAAIAFCKYYEIDIMQHIKWKMQYNSTRGIKHGKVY